MKHTLGFSLVLICLFSVCVGVSAQARQAVRNTADLSGDPKVEALTRSFKLVSRSNVVYAHCQNMYALSPEQIAYQKVAFDTVSDKYIRAFYDAYITRVGYPPNKIVIDNYMKYIYGQEATYMKEAADTIAKRTCDHGTITTVIKGIEKMRLEDLAAKERLAGTKPATPDAPAIPSPTATTPGSL